MIKLSAKSKKIFTIGFTGHRPKHLDYVKWGSELHFSILNQIKVSILLIMEEKIKEGYKNFDFVMGGAIGIDQMAFDAVWELKHIFKEYEMTISISVPFENQDCKWVQEDRDRYRKQLLFADDVIIVDMLDRYKVPNTLIGEYHKNKLLNRNKHMVNQSNVIIAIWNGKNGGTSHCVRYAIKSGVPVKIIKPLTYRDLIVKEKEI